MRVAVANICFDQYQIDNFKNDDQKNVTIIISKLQQFFDSLHTAAVS